MNRLQQFLSHIQIVMVNTTLPANIGSAARAMHTMGLSNLVVVDPKLPLNDDAYAHAAGARHILDNIRLVPTLQAAIQDCHWVLATSSRQRHLPKPVLTPRQAAHLLLDYADSHADTLADLPPTMAIVFGREDRGLTNEELQLADYHIQIPANPDYSVLNVAAAVQVIASVLYETAEAKWLSYVPLLANDNSSDTSPNKAQAALLDDNDSSNQLAVVIRQQWDAPAVSQQQQAELETKLLDLLTQLNIYHPEQSKVMPQRVNRLLGRLQLDVKEYQLLQALIAKLTHASTR